ncbi:MAG: hypothetical protein C3F08_05930 [Candidatus Methylomirabilota bacterium]|nr:MAG: hypothetical protein C3F08_05930 [candidate division NC10 bacterium]
MMAVRQAVNDTPKDAAEKSNIIRLVDYLTRLALLRTKIIRDVSEYPCALGFKTSSKTERWRHRWVRRARWGQIAYCQAECSRLTTARV